LKYLSSCFGVFMGYDILIFSRMLEFCNGLKFTLTSDR